MNQRFLDPSILAKWQVRDDHEKTRRFRALLPLKQEKMCATAHGFLRGSAPLFMRLVEQMKLGSLLDHEAWIVGDMHLENVGAYRTDHDEVVFDLNDFDGAMIAPVAYDLLRLLTSMTLTARGASFSAPQALAFTQSALDAWATAAGSGRTSATGPAIRAMRKDATDRPFSTYLDERAPDRKGERRFVRGDRYVSLAKPWNQRAKRLLADYLEALGPRAPGRSIEMVDAAQRIAGTGSLGCVRIAYVLRIGDDTHRLFELKEAPTALLKTKFTDAAQRIVLGARQLVKAPPRGLAALPRPVAGVRFIGRRLEPQQQKLNLQKLPRDEFEVTFNHIASLLGRAHRRSFAHGAPRWSRGETRRLLTHAATLAGLHEGIYLSYALAGGG